MAKSRQPRKATGTTVDFQIDSPLPVPPPSNTVTADGAGLITVTMDDGGSSDRFAARIFLFDSAGKGMQQDGPVDFPPHVASGKRSCSINVGSISTPVPSGNNRIVEVENKDSGRNIGHPFRVIPNQGSGSGSGSGSEEVVKEFQFKHCRPGQLVPVALTLKPDSKVTKGTCAKCAELNRPTLLVHSQEAKLAGSWFSKPIAFCGKGAPLGFWVLQRNSPTAWTLVLKQAELVLVTYTTKTRPKDCSLPVKLQRTGVGKKVCKDWPKTVTISPGP